MLTYTARFEAQGLLGLAPMEGVSDFATRIWFSQTGCPDYACTPFLRVTPGYPPHRIPVLFAPELSLLRQRVRYSLVPQLMASSADDFERLAVALLGSAAFVEINCGCPSPTVVGNGAGSSLLRSPEVFSKMIEGLALKLGPGRLAVKMRTGFTCSQAFPELLDGLRPIKLARLTVHGRTRADRYTGYAKWSLISTAAQTAKDCAVIGSGDICGYETFKERRKVAPDLAGVIIGRGALRNPWIFSELRSGQPQEISHKTLATALGVFGILQTLAHDYPERLLAVASAEMFQGTCERSEADWQHLFDGLTKQIDQGGRSLETLQLSPRMLSRVKMLWHYLRSGLPKPYQNPHLLRSTSFGQLTQGLGSARLANDSHESLTLGHEQSLDWLYSGAKAETPPQSP